ncbi:MAG: hypothetical protein DYG96_10160 [Chlorobi bacterium CHB2]|nr:hypothetical protein [Chlorobi bacterium CHB2]
MEIFQMRHSTILLLLAAAFFSFGYTKDFATSGAVSKIYLIDRTLIRTTPGEGIHFYDVSTPSNPREIGKIILEGNNDVAVQGRYLYADRLQDLIVFDISNPAAPIAVDSIGKVFNRVYGNGWIEEGVQIDEEGSSGGFSGCNGCSQSESPVYAPVSQSSGRDAAASGKAGSLARFMIVGDYLYCLDEANILVFDIKDPARPRYRNAVTINWGIETIFHSGNHLFIGANNGMYILNVDDPNKPTFVSEFTHARTCDPVVVEGNRAYVTLRGGSPCGGFTNQMDILDISDIKQPTLIHSMPLTGPYGLTVRDGIVIVCDGTAGVRVVDAQNPNNPQQIGEITGIIPHDVIASGSLLVVTAQDGYHLYDISNIRQPKRFSTIPLP